MEIHCRNEKWTEYEIEYTDVDFEQSWSSVLVDLAVEDER